MILGIFVIKSSIMGHGLLSRDTQNQSEVCFLRCPRCSPSKVKLPGLAARAGRSSLARRRLTRLKPGSHHRFASVRRAERERGAYENKGAGGQNRSRRARSARSPCSFGRSQCEPVKNMPATAAEERVSNVGDTFRSKTDSFYLLALNA